MRFSIDDIIAIAKALRSAPDHRPERLKSLHEACLPVNLYYRLLYELSVRSGPAEALEIGTYYGVSAAHLAANPAVHVVTVDCNSEAKVRTDRLGIPNITAITADSVVYGKALSETSLLDLLYVDGNHTFNQAYGEYETYRPHVKDGGLILFDDIRLPMATREMDVFWEYIVDPKAELHGMHHTGFGVCKVDKSQRLPSWTEVIGAASSRWAAASVPIEKHKSDVE